MTISSSNPTTGAPAATPSPARSHYPHRFDRHMQGATTAAASPSAGALLSTDMLRWIASSTGFTPIDQSGGG